MTNNNQVIADKYAGFIPLTGLKKASYIRRRQCDYANVKAIDGSISMQVNWPTVERKMQSDKLFYAC